MSIRQRLLWLGLATLALPWAGCQYAREMESSLRAAEQQGLLAVAQSIATSLQGRVDLLYHTGNAPNGAPGPLDFEPVPLSSDPVLDGAADDWPAVTHSWRRFESGKGISLAVLTGVHEHYLYVLLDVTDSKLVFDASDAAALERDAMGDRIWLGLISPTGLETHYFVSGWSAGAVRARRIDTREYGRQVAIDEPRIEGAIQPRRGGWIAELKVPLSMVGGGFGVLIDDRDQQGGEPISVGSLSPKDLAVQGRVTLGSEALAGYLAQFRQPGVRLAAATPYGAVLAEADALPVPSENGKVQSLLSRLYRRFLDRDSLAERGIERERGRLDQRQVTDAAAGLSSTALLATTDEKRLVVAAAAPVRERANGSVIGVLQVVQSVDRWLVLRDRALTRLLNLTLLVTAIAMLAIFGFTAWLSWRLGRLQRASESALSREGLLSTAFPDQDARDELGDVARSFSALLGRLDAYTSYLRTLAGKLTHEIRTPLTIVKSSLENLDAEQVPDSARVYVARAREGSARLGAILQAMGAATRVEEAIGHAERSHFDVDELLRSAVQAYRTAFANHRFESSTPGTGLSMLGAPDLILQMLDKLVDNAVDFSAPGTSIRIALQSEDLDWVTVSVENTGPPLPEHAAGQLFESLWQSRPAAETKPHFGLGLYIVRLIAEFHGGSALASNLPDGSGVRFSVRLRRNTS